MTQDSSSSSAIKIENLPLLDLLPIPSPIEYSSDDVKMPPLLNKKRFSQIMQTYPAVDYYLKKRKQDRSELAETSVSASDSSDASEHSCPSASPAESKGQPTDKSKRDSKRQRKALACKTPFGRPRNDGQVTQESSRNDLESPTSGPLTASGPGPACDLQAATTDCAGGAQDASDSTSIKESYELDENPVTVKRIEIS